MKKKQLQLKEKKTQQRLKQLKKPKSFVSSILGFFNLITGETATILRGKLGRKSVADKETVEGLDELPFPRNRSFLGREKEIIEMEIAFFGNREYLESTAPSSKGEASG